MFDGIFIGNVEGRYIRAVDAADSKLEYPSQHTVLFIESDLVYCLLVSFADPSSAC